MCVGWLGNGPTATIFAREVDASYRAVRVQSTPKRTVTPLAVRTHINTNLPPHSGGVGFLPPVLLLISVLFP